MALLPQRPRPGRRFERLYRRHVGGVYRYALAVLRSRSEAEAVTRTTFLIALRTLDRGGPPPAWERWLMAIAHDLCRRCLADRGRRLREEDGADPRGVTEVEWSEADYRRALRALTGHQRAVLVLREQEGRRFSEISQLLGLVPSAVERLVFDARRALREELESSLTCGEAERAISRRLDGRLTRRERAALREHLSRCPSCTGFAGRQGAQREALRSLAEVPVPSSLPVWPDEARPS